MGPMGDCNHHFKRNESTTLSVYSVAICVAAVWNEGVFPKFLKEVGPLARILSINEP
jgi:hypothetical protein